MYCSRVVDGQPSDLFLTGHFINLWILVMVNIWLRLMERAVHAIAYFLELMEHVFFRTVDEVQTVDVVCNYLCSDVRLMNVIVFYFFKHPVNTDCWRERRC